MVLIFTNKEDSHPNLVIEHLEKMGVPVFRFNTEALLTDYEFCWRADSSGCDFLIHCKETGLSVKGSEITAIWDRRPEKPSELPVRNTAQIDRHNLEEALGFLRFMRYYLKDIPSIGNIVNDIPASSKMLQMKVAHEIGLNIPATCMSNGKSQIVNSMGSAAVLALKPIESSLIWDESDESEWLFMTQKTTLQDISNAPAEAFSQTVSFVQEYIEKAFELRVTVVGDRVFSCRIDSQSQQDDTGKIDWRQGYGNGIGWSQYELPNNISCKCLEYLHKMGLNFGCFDFIVTPSGEYVFLECNPNGQWLWVELETGLPISQAIAAWLANKRSR